MQITEGKCQKIGKIILLQNRTALFPDHTPAENGGAKCPINCDTYSPGALIHNNFLILYICKLKRMRQILCLRLYMFFPTVLFLGDLPTLTFNGWVVSFYKWEIIFVIWDLDRKKCLDSTESKLRSISYRARFLIEWKKVLQIDLAARDGRWHFYVNASPPPAFRRTIFDIEPSKICLHIFNLLCRSRLFFMAALEILFFQKKV